LDTGITTSPIKPVNDGVVLIASQVGVQCYMFLLTIIDIGQNASNPHPSITTNEPATKDNTTAKLASTLEDMSEVPSIMMNGPPVKGGTPTLATPTVEDMSEVPSITTNKPTAKGGIAEKLAAEAEFEVYY